MRFRGVLLAATVLAAPFAVHAQPVSGLYLGAGAGGDYRQSQNVRGLNINAGPGAGAVFGSGVGGVPLGVNTGLKKDDDIGPIGVLSLGYGFGNGLRVEVEGSARSNRLYKLAGTPFPTSSGGDEVTYAGMANVFYDFDPSFLTGTPLPVQPYVGVGAGYAETTFSGLKSYGTNFPYFQKSNDSNGNFAYQAILGVAYPLTFFGVPGLTFTTEYRFLGVLDGARYHGSIDTTSGRSFITTAQGNQFNHAILVGVRYAFNQPATAAAGPAAGRCPGPGPGPLLPRVLRLGPLQHYRPRAADHPRGGGELDPGAGTRGLR